MDKKLVVIPTNGHIIPLGGILGPVVEPHMQDLKVISVLLMQNYKVSEVLNDGTHLPLDLKNFDKDNNVVVVKEEAPKAPEKGEGIVEDTPPEGSDKQDQEPKKQEQKHQHNNQQKKNKGLQADQTQSK